MLDRNQISANQGFTRYPLSDAENRPLAIDLYCGLGGWAEGFLSEGWRVVGFDIERHDYGTGGYPGQLVIQDVRTLRGWQFKNAAVIVASPPCQAYSYRAMPWKRAKALPPPDNTLFEQPFRIQREACEAAGRHIPLIVENVRGAQKWVGQAKWRFGSYYIWGDVPALMPPNGHVKVSGLNWKVGSATYTKKAFNDTALARMGWTGSIMREGTSHGLKRKAASAQIAKIPFPLAQHIARVFKPVVASLLFAFMLAPALPKIPTSPQIEGFVHVQLEFPFVTTSEPKTEVTSPQLTLEPGALPLALEQLSAKYRPFIDRVMSRLSEAERQEINLHLKADYRQSWICLSFANRGIADPFVVASYQMYGIHPDKVWERIVADRKARLGAEYYDWYTSDDLRRPDVPKIPPISSAGWNWSTTQGEPSDSYAVQPVEKEKIV